jgi:hypothetical protein
MAREDFATAPFDPDFLVSWNLQRARGLRGWTQMEATQHLARYGLEWSVASLSDAERAWSPDGRMREFTASDLVAFSLAYDLPLAWWFLPAPPDELGGISVRLDGTDEPLDDATIVNLCLSSSPEIEERIASLGLSRTLASEDKRRLLALLEAQETQLAEWAAAVKEARFDVEQHTHPPSADGGEER